MGDHVDDRFEWDVGKSERCLAERGFDFAFASRVFDFEPYYEEADERERGEERYWCVGLIEGGFFTVVYTPRGLRKRIISAWQSDDDEILRFADHAGLGTQ